MAITFSDNHDSSGNAKNDENYKYTAREGFRNLNSAVSDMLRTVQANGIRETSQEELYYKFQRIPALDARKRLNYTKEFLFFTKPDLQILQNTSNILRPSLKEVPIFNWAQTYYPDVLRQLQYSASSSKYPFMNILSNTKKSNLELPSITANNDIETAVNIFGTKMTYRGSSYSSDDGFEFSIEFEDTRYLELYMLFRIYDEYESRKQYGIIDIPQYYADQKILHDQFSIYKFIVDEDFETLVYWAKLTGVYPKNVPRETFSDLPENGGLSYSIQFHAAFVEDMKPEILYDFNTVTNGTASGAAKSWYDDDIQMTNPDWCQSAYIDNSSTVSRHPIIRPKLKWR